MATRNTPKRKNSNANSRPPPGFRSPIRPHAAPIDQMSARELHDLHRRNAHILAAEPYVLILMLTDIHLIVSSEVLQLLRITEG